MKEIEGLENISFESATVYTILEEIGRGGMGVVYLAERSCMGVSDLVVLKTIRSISVEEEESLRQEANIATRLRHENIVKTYGLEGLPYSSLPRTFQRAAGVAPPIRGLERRRGRHLRAHARRADGGRQRERIQSVSIEMPMMGPDQKKLLMIVMDYVDGVDVHSLLHEHSKLGCLMPPMIGAFVVSRICRALSYAHETIVHRDISPDNIMIDRHGVCKLSDFGIAAAADDETRQVAGKTLYMAPEAYTGQVDERSDVFSLGIVFYHLLTGIMPLWTDHRSPFASQREQVREQLAAGIPAPHVVRTDIPEEIGKIVDRMIDPDPDRRYPRIGAVGDEIERDYLYARGFGPTNNSLAAYIRIVENGFKDPEADDLGQLSFLRGEEGRVDVRRKLRLEDFTKTGIDLVKARKGSPIYKMLSGQEQQKRQARPSKRRGRACFKVRFGDNLLETFFPGSEPMTIGRDPSSNRCVLPDPGASRNHARILVEEGQAILEDAGSNNGTYLNGERVERSALREGDRIQIGSCMIYYLSERRLQPADEAIDVVPGQPLDLDDARDVSLRFASDPASIDIVAQAADRLMAEVELKTLGQTFGEVLRRIAGDAPRPLEARFGLGSNRVVLQILDPSDPGIIAPLFLDLKRTILTGDTAEDPTVRQLLNGVDRFEFVTEPAAIRLAKSI